MNTLPPLPLIDGCLFLDNSFLERLLTCARSAEYDFLYKRRATENASALGFGGALHKAWELRYNRFTEPIKAVEKDQLNLLDPIFNEMFIVDGDFRTLDLAKRLTQAYNEAYPTEQFEIFTNSTGQPLVEQSFAVELCRLPVPTSIHPSGFVVVIWTGRIDLLVRLDGQIFTLDHKTTSILGASFWETQAMSAQHKGYIWATQKVFDVLPAGYIINAVRTRKPYRETKDGRVLLKKEQVDSEDFVRQKFYVSQSMIDEWEENTIALCREFLWKYEQGYFPMEQMWCVGKFSRCQYYDVCSLPKENRAAMLASGMYVDNDWSPLNHVKQKEKEKECQSV